MISYLIRMNQNCLLPVILFNLLIASVSSKSKYTTRSTHKITSFLYITLLVDACRIALKCSKIKIGRRKIYITHGMSRPTKSYS